MPPDRAVDAVPTIVASPFPGERGRVPCFGGCDGACVGNRTARVFRPILRGTVGDVLHLPWLAVPDGGR